MPAGLHRNFIEIAMANALTKPGATSLLGSPLDLSKIDVDSYVVAGIDDHIVPWPSAYRATQLLGSRNIRFVLSTSGHVAALVNPPSNSKATYRLAPGNPPDHRDWLAQAETVPAAGGPDHTTWLADRSGDMKQAPRTLGNAKFPPLKILRQAPTSPEISPLISARCAGDITLRLVAQQQPSTATGTRRSRPELSPTAR